MPDDNPPDWVQIVEMHAERVFRIAFRILGSVHDAEDVAQSVFVEAFELYQQESIQNWIGLLVRLVSFRSIDLLRQRQRMVELNDEVRVSTIGPVDEAIGSEIAAWLRKAVQRLPEQQAVIFSLCCFENLTRQEVSALLQISPEAVSTALCKARQRLMTELTTWNGGC